MATEAQTCAVGILANRRNPPKSTGPHSQKVLEIPSITLFLFALVALWLKNPFNQRNPRLKKYSSCRVLGPLHLSRILDKSHLFMQNKANFLDALMNVKSIHTVVYENIANWTLGENKPNQTQFPKSTNECKLTYNKGLQKKRRFRSPKKQSQNKPNFRKARMNLNFYSTKEYENVPLRRRGENKPNQTQFQTQRLSEPCPERSRRRSPEFRNSPYEEFLTLSLTLSGFDAILSPA